MAITTSKLALNGPFPRFTKTVCILLRRHRAGSRRPRRMAPQACGDSRPLSRPHCPSSPREEGPRPGADSEEGLHPRGAPSLPRGLVVDSKGGFSPNKYLSNH